MNTPEYWSLVDRVHAASRNDMKKKCDLLATELRQLSPAEVCSFEDHFSDCLYRAYTWDIWGAAFVINDGCSDDSFMDFRSTLISLGRAPFEAALTNADSLAEVNIESEWATFEGYQYVAPKVYESLTGEEMSRRVRPPQSVSGIPFNEWEMSLRFPKLAAKYGYQDSHWLYLKEQLEKGDRDVQAADRLMALMLEAEIIPSCGLVPPPRIVAKVLRLGRAPESTGRQFAWEPYELDEGHYWIAVNRLQKIRPEALRSRPDLQGVKFNSDVGATGVNEFDDWIQTLRDRGLA